MRRATLGQFSESLEDKHSCHNKAAEPSRRIRKQEWFVCFFCVTVKLGRRHIDTALVVTLLPNFIILIKIFDDKFLLVVMEYCTGFVTVYKAKKKPW